jgi:hypothetical protein
MNDCVGPLYNALGHSASVVKSIKNRNERDSMGMLCIHEADRGSHEEQHKEKGRSSRRDR